MFPTCVNVSLYFTLMFLSSKKIYTYQPQSVKLWGRLNVMCFDKTGTLTEEAVNIIGSQIIKKISKELTQFSEMINAFQIIYMSPDYQQVRDLDNQPEIMAHQIFSSCHNLQYFNKKLVGDPLDLMMFQYTRCTIEDPNSQILNKSKAISIIKQEAQWGNELDKDDHNIYIWKIFEFSSLYQTMSVVVQNFNENNLRLHVKGSPERIKQLCLPESLPSDFDRVLDYNARMGRRIIGLATKNLQKMKLKDAKLLKRSDLENNLTFIGLLLFENKIKPVSRNVIKQLQKAEIQTLMVSGDHLLTTMSIAKDCGLVNKTQKVYIAEMDRNNVVWKEFDNANSIRTQSTNNIKFKFDIQDNNQFVDTIPWDNLKDNSFILGINGEVFDYYLDNSINLTNRDESIKNIKIFERILLNCKVYGRMKPEQKKSLIRSKQKFLMIKQTQTSQNQKNIVGMCGDGANDCAALKAADVGISLSDREASIASNFMSMDSDISSIISLISVGKSKLSANMACFRFMMMYCIIQLITKYTLLQIDAYLPEFQYLYYDYYFTLMAVLMMLTQSSNQLSSQYPRSNILSYYIFISLSFQSLIYIIYQIIALYIFEKYNTSTCQTDRDDHIVLRCQQQNAIFIIGSIQCTTSLTICVYCQKFRQNILTNIIYSISYLANIAFILSLIFYDQLQTIFNIHQLPLQMQIEIMILGITNIVTIFLIEICIFERIFK